MKKITISLLLAALSSSSVLASEGQLAHGPYLGVSLLGISRDNTPADELFTNQLGGTAFTGRPFVGYRFNDYFSAEVGYDFIDSESGDDISTDSNGVTTHYPYSINMQGGDIALLVNKIIQHVNIYALGGVAIIHTKLYNVHYFGPITDINETDALPEAGGGIDYFFSKHFSLGLTTTYMFGEKNTPNVWTYGSRISYIF